MLWVWGFRVVLSTGKDLTAKLGLIPALGHGLSAGEAAWTSQSPLESRGARGTPEPGPGGGRRGIFVLWTLPALSFPVTLLFLDFLYFPLLFLIVFWGFLLLLIVILCYSLPFLVIPCYFLLFPVFPCHSLLFPVIPRPQEFSLSLWLLAQRGTSQHHRNSPGAGVPSPPWSRSPPRWPPWAGH